MYLLSRKIKAMGVKMVLSGEGSDEILGGMLTLLAWLCKRTTDKMAIRLSLFPRGTRPEILPLGMR